MDRIKQTRAEARAITQRWPIKPEYREAIIKRMMRIVTNPNSSSREVTAATKALMAAESQNQSDEHKVIDVRVQTRHDELSGIARDLGIEVSVIEHAAGSAGLSASGTDDPRKQDATE